jgi:tryptophan-rich sensory protein
MRPARYLALLGFLAAAFIAGGIGSAATFENVRSWYPSLQKPSWTPPNWLFGPVWTCLYVAMSVAAWRVWRRSEGSAARTELTLYAAQITLNLFWSIVFFGLRNPALGLIDIVLLWSLLLTMQIRFFRADRIAALLWLPYLLWVSFATALNASIWWLNR